MSSSKESFGGTKTKMDLIRTLLKARLRADQMAQLAGVTPDLVDQQSDEDVLGTPEAT